MLNMINLKKTEELAKEVRTWCLKDIYSAVSSVAFYLWPTDKVPRNFSIVMDKFMQRMSVVEDVYRLVSVDLIDSSLNNLVEIIYKELMMIDEFRDWNLTELEHIHGVNPDDERPNEWWDKSDKDFVDLIAFKQNVYCVLRSKLIEDYFFEY